MNNLVARPHSSVDKIPQIVAVARKSASSRLMHPLEKRRQQLMQAFKMVSENEQLLSAAMSADLKRNSAENHFVELYPVQANIVQALNNLDDWNHVEPVTPSIVFMMDKCETRRVPLGCVLIIGTWNYALTLILDPLVAALAGGNTAVVKLSEVSTNMTNVLAHLIEKYMDPKVVQIVTGAVPETTVLLNQKFDLIFYTGSTTVGRIIMQQAAKTLTPVLLELGGKSPVIVDEDCDFEATASRILWGKIVNCGQTCIAPDYVLVHKKAEKQLLAAFKSQFTKIVDGDFDTSDQYGRIISQGHFDRLKGLLDSQLKVAGTKTLIGGKTDRSSLFFEPTVLTGVGLDAETNPVMAGELFGPILPVIVVASIDEAIRYVNSRYAQFT